MNALPVLYSFRRCPYAMRARLALAVSGQRCELREVVLRAKPQGLLQASPKGTVPVLVLHHAKDACTLCQPHEVPAILRGLKNAQTKKEIMVSGGENPTGNVCEALHWHVLPPTEN